MKITKKLLTLLIASSSLLMYSCDDDDDESTPAATTSSVEVALTGLDDLSSSTAYEYEGWLIIDGTPNSTGRFSKAADAGFTYDSEKLKTATMYVLTVEPKVNDVAEPSELKVMAGTIADGKAVIGLNAGSLFAETTSSFAGADGVYKVAAPTAGGQEGFDNSGIWFFKEENGEMVAGLNLPALDTMAYVYEGWVVVNGTALSTGTFTTLTGADKASPYSDGGPAFPGEDFVNDAPKGVSFPVDVTMHEVVISVEPANDLDPSPFFLKPLIKGDLESGNLGLNALPSGTLTVK